MAISFNDIPTGIRTPFVTLEFDGSKAQQGTSIKSYRGLVIGQRLAAGTVAELVPTLVTSAEDASAFFGDGSILHNMAEAWFANNRFTETWFVAQDDAVGTQATGTVTIAGTATAAGTVYLYIGGRRVQTNVANGDAAATVATAMAAAITAVLGMPVTAVAVVADVNLTARQDGTLGNDIDLRVNYASDELLPAGITVDVTSTPMAGGATDPDVDAVWAVLGEVQYDVLAVSYTDSSNLGKVDIELADRWGPLRQIEGIAFGSLADTHANLVTAGQGYNSKHLSLLGATLPLNPPWEYAGAYGAVAAFYLAQDPARPLQTLPLKFIKSPANVDLFTQPEAQILLLNGIATSKGRADGSVAIERAITTYQTNAVGADDTAYLDVNTPATLAYLRYDFRQLFLLRYSRHKLGADSKRYGIGQAIMTPKLGRSEAIARFMLWEELALVEGLEQFKADLVVEVNGTDPNRLDFLLPTDLVNQLRVIAGKIEFRL